MPDWLDVWIEGLPWGGNAHHFAAWEREMTGDLLAEQAEDEALERWLEREER